MRLLKYIPSKKSVQDKAMPQKIGTQLKNIVPLMLRANVNLKRQINRPSADDGFTNIDMDATHDHELLVGEQLENSQLARLFQTVASQPKRGGGEYYYRMLEICRARVLLVWGVMGLIFLALALRTMLLPFTDASSLLDNPRKTYAVEKLRSDIVDRNGEILASSAMVKSLNAEVPMMRRANVDFADAAERLSVLFPQIDKQELLGKFERLAHFPILNRMTPEQSWQVRKLGIPGIYTLRKEGRIYPHAEMMGHVVGFVDNDNRGQSGIELKFNSVLNRAEEKIALSVDIRLQHILTQSIARVFKEQNAKAACGLIMDVKSSEILGMASFPAFDPHHVNRITPDKYFNCTTQSAYELGSTFKLITAAMGLQAGTASLETVYDTTRPIRYNDRVISDVKISKFPYDLRQVITYSSNIGAALIARDVGGDRQREFLARLGLLSVSAIELEGKSRPLIAEKNDELTTMTISFGHSIAVSPLHLVSAVNTIISDGVYRKPTLLHIPEVRRAKAPGIRVVSPEVSNALRQLMYLVVKDGTGRAARLPGYVVGGKTGTAEKLIETSFGLRYSSDNVLSTFLAAFPMHDPQYIIYVLFDEPQGKNNNGAIGSSVVAVPVVKEIIERMTPFVKIAPYNENSTIVRDGLGLDNRGNPKKSSAKPVAQNGGEL